MAANLSRASRRKYCYFNCNKLTACILHGRYDDGLVKGKLRTGNIHLIRGDAYGTAVYKVCCTAGQCYGGAANAGNSPFRINVITRGCGR